MHRNLCQLRLHENKMQRSMQQTFGLFGRRKNVKKAKSLGAHVLYYSRIHIWCFVYMILLLFLFHLHTLALIYRCFAERLHFIFFSSFRLFVIATVCVNEYLTLTQFMNLVYTQNFHGIFAFLPFIIFGFVQTQTQSNQFVSAFQSI